MAETYTESNETRLYFDFERNGETKTRYIALPGVPAEESERRTTVINNFKTFRTQLLNLESGQQPLTNFVQPADWRDATGSGASTDTEEWKTTDVQLEFYVVQKTRFDGLE